MNILPCAIGEAINKMRKYVEIIFVSESCLLIGIVDVGILFATSSFATVYFNPTADLR
jgi:hypothetical protein